jgi:hypothetical protein
MIKIWYKFSLGALKKNYNTYIVFSITKFMWYIAYYYLQLYLRYSSIIFRKIEKLHILSNVIHKPTPTLPLSHFLTWFLKLLLNQNSIVINPKFNGNFKSLFH